MIADPLTIPSSTLAFSGSYPAATETLVQGKSLNTLSQNGRSSTRSFGAADLSTLGLTKGELNISHTITNQNRMRSVLRCDASKKDASNIEHGVAVYLVVDKEVAASSEREVALSRALGVILELMVSGTGSGAMSTASQLTEFLNGEP